MCYHRRTVFRCNHFAWGAVVKPCQVEKAFLHRQPQRTCGEMMAHPLHSRRISVECACCVAKRQKMDKAIAEFRLRLRALCLDMEVREARNRRGRSASSSSSSLTTSTTATAYSSDDGASILSDASEDEEELDSFEEELVRDTEVKLCMDKLDDDGLEAEDESTRDMDSLLPTVVLLEPNGSSVGLVQIVV